MLENFLFLVSCLFFFLFIAGIVVVVDFCGYLLTDRSILLWLEKILIDKFIN